MTSSRVVAAAALVFAAMVPLSAAAARPTEPELGLPVDLSAGTPADAVSATGSRTSASPNDSKSRRAFVSDVAEPKSYLLMLAGLGVLAFVANRRKLG